MDSISFNEIFSLLQSSDETDRIEAKTASHGIGKSFLETVCALSNEPDLGGGYILLGIAKNEDAQDFKYVITGVSDPDKLQNDIASQCRQCFNGPLSKLRFCRFLCSFEPIFDFKSRHNPLPISPPSLISLAQWWIMQGRFKSEIVTRKIHMDQSII